MNWSPPAPGAVGWLIALLVLLLAVVFMAVGRLDYVPGGLIAGAALARLV